MHRSGRQCFGHFFQDVLPQQPRGAVVQFHKVGRHPRFQRKAAQKAGAETVNGLNAQATRRFDGAGEQAAGAGHVGGVGGIHLSQFGQGLGQFGIRHHGPSAKALEQTVLHLCRGGFGISQA